MHKLLVLVLALASALVFSNLGFAAGPQVGRIHFLLLDAQEQPVAGATVRGACQSGDGAFFGGKKLPAPWSCTTDARGVCSTELPLLPLPDNDRANVCKAKAPTEIIEPGAAAVKTSYFTFFADGQADSYNMLQKGGSWKHGDYFFNSLENQSAFHALVSRNSSDFYRNRITVQDDPAAPVVTLDTAAAHPLENQEFLNTEFLRVRIDRKTRVPSVHIVVTDTYIDYSLRMLHEARYPTAAGEKRVELSVDKQGSTCNLRDLFERKCTYRETASFPVELEAFRQAAAAYVPGKRTLWRFQTQAKSGHERTRALTHAEFHALALALDDALARSGK